MGTVFGYTQFDAVARYQRMRGRNVFFPIGWDDNGLATERRVQNYYGVRCDPAQPYDPDFTPPFRGDVPATRTTTTGRSPSRGRTSSRCASELTAIDEAAFEELFRRLGMSFDWSTLYTTIDERSRRASQAAFLHNLARGEAYSAEAPTVWDVDDRTAVAQAEIEDRERPGAYHLIAFHGADGDVLVDTTRPELIVSCVALVAHPDDERYQPLFGATVRTPLFGVEVPVVAHPLAQPDKGTGIAMVCTFGDTTDVTWWRELDLPTRSVIGRDGRFLPATPPWLDTDAAREAYAALAGRTVKQAQAAMVDGAARVGRAARRAPPDHPPGEVLRAGQPPARDRHEPPVVHPQRRSRRGPPRGVPHPRQGARLVPRPHAPPLRALGGGAQRRLADQPPALLRRADPAVVPASAPTASPTTTTRSCPTSRRCRSTRRPTCRRATTPTQRGEPGGFVGDADIMDTWATSSLTPQIAAGWVDDPELFARVFPMDLRPQGPEIIRTWLFATVVRSHYEHGSLPWASDDDQRLDPRPRPQEDVEVEGQRRHADGAVRPLRHGRRALLGDARRGPAWTPRSARTR